MNNFVVIDIETTGLKAEGNGITEICALKYDHKFNYDYAITNNLFNPKSNIPEVITNITGITEKMVKYKENFKHGLDRLMTDYIVSGVEDIYIAHNAKFEYDFMSYYKESFKNVRWICTGALFQYYIRGEANKYWKGWKLQDACKYFGVEYKQEDAHRAEYDVLKTAIIANKLINIIGLKNSIRISKEFIIKGFYKDPSTQITLWERETW